MSNEETHWISFSTRLDEHPFNENHRAKSESLLFSDCEWIGSWEVVGAVSSGDWYEGGGGAQRAWIVWKRPCRVKDDAP
jgi:hypothetical protein